MTPRRISVWIACLALLLAAPPLAAAPCDVKTPLQFIGLAHADKMSGLENVSQMADICGRARDKAACAIRALNPQWDSIRVHDAPGGRALGVILVSYVPEQGVVTRYLDLESAEMTSFQPFIYDGDWSYGPWAHEPIYERRSLRGAEWVRIRIPVPDLWGQRADGWVRAPADSIYVFGHGTVVSYNGKDYVIDAVTEKSVILVDAAEITRMAGEPEDSGPACMSREAVGKAINELREEKTGFLTLPLGKPGAVYDDLCQPRLTLAYTRGCQG